MMSLPDRDDTTPRCGDAPGTGVSVPVTMICPNLKCGRTVTAADAARGKVVRCAHCQQLFMVPSATHSGIETVDTDGNAAETPPPKRRARR